MAHPNEDQTRESFAAFGRGDLEAFRRQIFVQTSDGTSLVAARWPETLKARRRCWELLSRVLELSGGTFRAELRDVLPRNEHTVALFTSHIERAGRRLEDHTAEILHIHDGKATEIWIHPGDLYAVNEFWS